MYLEHYNLTVKPFEISPDPKFLWLGEQHKQALAAMKHGILDNKGFISLTGDVGTGKTTLVTALANSLEDNIIFAQVPDPSLKQLVILNLTADALEMNKRFSTRGDLLIHLGRFLNNAYDHHKEVVLVIEEAHRFDPERLEEVRLISNIEKPDKKLINMVFVGQNEFNSILKKNKPLRQRVAIIHKIEPLQEIETEQYAMHRLKTAGSERKIFSPEAIREIYSFSEGNPRLINIICDLALLAGCTKEKKIVAAEIIRECAANYLLSKQRNEDAIEDLRASAKLIPEPETGIEPASSSEVFQKIAKKAPSTPTGFKPAYVTAMSVVFLLSIFGYLYFFGENHAPYRNIKTFLGKAFDRYTGSKLETSSQKPDGIASPQSNIAGTQVQALDLIAQKTSIENQLGQMKSRNEALTADLEELERYKKEIAALQGQLLDLQTQKTSSDTQLDQLKSRNEELAADLAELKGAKERIAELEGVAAKREQTLSEAEQKATELTKALDREKTSRDTLISERSMKADLVAELQEKLEAALSSRAEMENDVEKSRNEIVALQEQLLDVSAQKDASENQLEQKRSSSELSLKTDLVTEFQQKLQASQTNQQELEKTIKKSEKEIAELQNQLRELKAQQAPTESSPVALDEKKESSSQSEASGEQGKSPNPSNIIDWVLNKKAK